MLLFAVGVTIAVAAIVDASFMKSLFEVSTKPERGIPIVAPAVVPHEDGGGAREQLW